MEQHERWVAARERLGMGSRKLRLVPTPEPDVVAPVFCVSTDPRDWEERPIAPYDHYVPKIERPLEATPAQLVLAQVAFAYGYTSHLLRSADRSWPVCRARNEAVYRLRRELGLSRGQIGRLLGYRDITTIASSERAHAKLLGEKVVSTGSSQNFVSSAVAVTGSSPDALAP
jgi:hypothetical protein